MTSNNPSTINRRSFLQTAAAAGTAVAAGTTLAALAPALYAGNPPQGRPFGDFLVGAQSYTFRNFNLEQALQRIHDLGLHYVELCNVHVPLNSTPAQIQAVLQLCRRLEITPIAFGVEGFTDNHDANRRKFEFARALGVRGLSADPAPNSFDSLDRLVQEFNINIAIHPHGPVGQNRLHQWYSAEVITQAVRSHHPWIGSCLDTGHLIRSAQAPFNRNLDPAAQVRVMNARNFGMHLKDHNNTTHRDVVFGRDGGVLDVPAVLRALREVRFQGWISIEYEANPDNPSPDVRACLDVLRTAIRQLG